MASNRHKVAARDRARQRRLAANERREAESESALTTHTCPRCGDELPKLTSGRGRPRPACSQRCRRAAYEERRAAANGAIAKEIVVQRVEPPWDETVRRVLESPKACKQVLRALSDRLATGELSYNPWDSVASELWHLNDAWKLRNRPRVDGWV